ncbi:MAG: hypothetical protein ACYDES_13020 [Acidimicrobiales bacterium]
MADDRALAALRDLHLATTHLTDTVQPLVSGSRPLTPEQSKKVEAAIHTLEQATSVFREMLRATGRSVPHQLYGDF